MEGKKSVVFRGVLRFTKTDIINSQMRYTYRKGFLWIFIYLILSLVPMGLALTGDVPAYRTFWIEFGVALGFIGLAMMGLQFVFSGRFAKIAPSYGMDNTIQFHREMGIISFLFVLAHPITLIIAKSEYLSYFDPRVNFLRAIALSYVTLAVIFITVTSLWRISFKLNYEKWRLLHGFLALSIVFVGIVHSIQVSHYLDPLWKKIAIAAIMGASMYLVIHTRIVRPWKNRRKPYRVLDVKPELGDSWTLTLEAEKHERLHFMPGQFAWITIGDTPFKLQQHPFSIASSPLEKNISFSAKEAGDFTKSLGKIPMGTRVFLEGPFGSFTPEKDKNLFLVMGGIGVTPAMSMLRTMRLENDPRQAILIYANKNWEEATFREELEQLSNQINLKVIHLLEEPPENWKGEKGLVSQDLLKKYLPDVPEKFMYFICGPGPLMDITESSISELGIDWRLIYTERFEIV